jgi:hypothetical protein
VAEGLNGVAVVTKQALRGVSAVLRRIAETMRSTTLAADTVGRRGLEWVVVCSQSGRSLYGQERSVQDAGQDALLALREQPLGRTGDTRCCLGKTVRARAACVASGQPQQTRV